METITLTDNTDASRFEVRKDGQVAAFAEYTLAQGVLTFTHTESMSQFAGQGLASKLAVFALDEVRRRGLKAIPRCEFFAAYIKKHPQYQDLLA